MFTFRCFRKSFSTLLLLLLASLTALYATEVFQPRGLAALSEPKPSSIFPVNVMITYESVVEKIMFADHLENLEEGNWIHACSQPSSKSIPTAMSSGASLRCPPKRPSSSSLSQG